MKNISDLIEEFILNQFLLEQEVNISRNELAAYFNCAPSQINYVLTTRFTPLRGYDIESRRGGGGYIKVNKILLNDENKYLQNLLKQVEGKRVDFVSCAHILQNLAKQGFLTKGEQEVLEATMQDKALANPMKAEGYIRGNMLKNLILSIMRRD